MRLLLLNPPNPSDSLQANRDYMGNFGMLNTRPGVVLPPLHLIQMGATIPADDFDLIDAAAEHLSAAEVDQRVTVGNYTHVIVLTSTPTFDLDCKVARGIKERTKAIVYLYGPHPAHVAQEAFEKSQADGILVGYTPKTLQTIVNASSPPSDLEELILPSKLRTPPPIAPSFKMDDLPIGSWSKTPLHRYRFHVYEPTPFATMRSSLGCVYSCAYCPYVLAEGQRFLPMSPERTYAEMEYLSKDLGVRFVLFRDLLFTAQRKRIEQLCDLLIKKPLDLVWRCETSTNHLSDDLLEKLRAAGCTGINLGVESVDETSATEMDLVSKRKDLEHLKQVFKTCANLGIRTNALFVIGFPEDSRKGILSSIEFARNLDAAAVQFAFATPFPGTELARIAHQEKMVEAHEWSEYSSLRPVMRTRHLSRLEVQELGRKALRDTYFQPKRILRLAKNPIQFVQRAHAFLRFYVGH